MGLAFTVQKYGLHETAQAVPLVSMSCGLLRIESPAAVSPEEVHADDPVLIIAGKRKSRQISAHRQVRDTSRKILEDAVPERHQIQRRLLSEESVFEKDAVPPIITPDQFHCILG